MNQHCPELLPILILAADKDNDNVLHQIVEFGRIDALNHLMPLAKYNPPVHDALQQAVMAKNQYQASPMDIALDLDATTMKKLTTSADPSLGVAPIISEEALKTSVKNRDDIAEILIRLFPPTLECDLTTPPISRR